MSEMGDNCLVNSWMYAITFFGCSKRNMPNARTTMTARPYKGFLSIGFHKRSTP